MDVFNYAALISNVMLFSPLSISNAYAPRQNKQRHKFDNGHSWYKFKVTGATMRQIFESTP